MSILSAEKCGRGPQVLGIFDVEHIETQKIQKGKPLFMVKWQGYCASQNTWEPKAHLPPEMIKAFITLNPDPVRVEEARERISLVLERGVNVPLQYEELIEVHHDMIQFLFPTLPADT